MHLVAFGDEKFREVGAILARYARDECGARHGVLTVILVDWYLGRGVLSRPRNYRQ